MGGWRAGLLLSLDEIEGHRVARKHVWHHQHRPGVSIENAQDAAAAGRVESGAESCFFLTR